MSLAPAFHGSAIKKAIFNVFHLPHTVILSEETSWDDMVWSEKELSALSICAAGDDTLYRATHSPGWQRTKTRTLHAILRSVWGVDHNQLGTTNHYMRDRAIRRMLETLMKDLAARLRRMVTPSKMVHTRDKARREEASRYVFKGVEFWRRFRKAMWTSRDRLRPQEGRSVTTVDFEAGLMGVMYSDMVVTVVHKLSHAHNAGVKVGWKIIRVNDVDVFSQTQLVQQLTQVRGFSYSVTFEYEDEFELDLDSDLLDNELEVNDARLVAAAGIFEAFTQDD